MQHFQHLVYSNIFTLYVNTVLLSSVRNFVHMNPKFSKSLMQIKWSNKGPSGQGLKMIYMVVIVFLLLRRMAWILILGINGSYRSVCYVTCLAVILIIVVQTDWKWMLLQTPDWPWLSGRPAPRHRGWWTRWSRTPRPVATAHLGLPDASLPGSATTEDTKKHLWVITTMKTHHSFIVY